MDFNRSIQLAETREAIIGSALGRYYNASICFISGQERLKEYDFCLYSANKGWAQKIEMQDDYYVTNMDQNLCFELYTHQKNGTKDGKIYYTKATKICYVLNNLKKILLLDVKTLKEFIISLEHQNLLNVYQPADHEAWIAKHDTAPTASALLPIKETLLQDRTSRVLTFEQLNIPANYDQFRFQRNNNN